MPAFFQTYKDFSPGVINAVEPSEIPLGACQISQNIYHRDGRWRKLPGLVEIHPNAVGGDPIWGLFKGHQLLPKKGRILVASGGSLYFFDETTLNFTSVYDSLTPNQPVEFMEYRDNVYFGSPKDQWRRYNLGGTLTYTVSGSGAPTKFSKMVYNPYSGRFFGIGNEDNPDYLRWSEHIDDRGIESWPDGNIQIIESVMGDTPQDISIYEQEILIFNQNSIHSGSVSGVPENWSVERQKSQTGTVARRTVKRYGNSFFMLTPNYEVYLWPDHKFITKGRVRFLIDPVFAPLACAEIVDDRYYYLCFKSGEGKGEQYYSPSNILQTDTLSNRYHLWIYDIHGDRWFGPHVGYSLSTLFWDKETNMLLSGGTEELSGWLMEHRGLDIKNKVSKVHWVSSYSDYGLPRMDKRYTRIYMKMGHEGVTPGGTGQLEVIVSTDQQYFNQQKQLVTLVDTSTPDNLIRDTASSTRGSITKRGTIPEQYGRGNAVMIEFRHEYLKGNFSFSEFDIQYYMRTIKENRVV